MMRTLIPVAVLFLSTTVHAQERSYEDLLILYVDEHYEKCIDKAQHYIHRDGTRRDPLPYLYMSLCNHEMSKLEKYTTDPEHKYAARDALKYAVKFRKKDKDLRYFANYADHWEELNTVAMDMGLLYLDEAAYSKARRQFQRMAQYYPENAGAWELLALVQLKMKLARDAAASMKSYRTAYSAIPDVDYLPKDQQRLLREAMIRYAVHLEHKGMLDSARATIALGKGHFSDNAEFKAVYEELN